MDPELLKKILRCSIELEKKVAMVYIKLSNKVSDPAIRVLFEVIALESDKHAVILERIVSLSNLMSQSISCREFLGSLYIGLEQVEEYLNTKIQLDLEELRKLLESLVIVEGFVGEETYHKLLIPLIKDFISEGNFVSMLVDKIILDEKFHEEAVKSVLSFLQLGVAKKS
uniref:Rubrerythrin diiron-binding domain-containing protein n=1 Tax=Ignisphaera aggregans TaxID=334771 RepID=A0A7C4FGH4_9CREN